MTLKEGDLLEARQLDFLVAAQKSAFLTQPEKVRIDELILTILILLRTQSKTQ